LSGKSGIKKPKPGEWKWGRPGPPKVRKTLVNHWLEEKPRSFGRKTDHDVIARHARNGKQEKEVPNAGAMTGLEGDTKNEWGAKESQRDKMGPG